MSYGIKMRDKYGKERLTENDSIGRYLGSTTVAAGSNGTMTLALEQGEKAIALAFNYTGFSNAVDRAEHGYSQSGNTLSFFYNKSTLPAPHINIYSAPTIFIVLGYEE